MKREDFKQYADSLRGKNQSYNKMMKQFEDVRSELAVLQRTEQILKRKVDMTDELIKNLKMSKVSLGILKLNPRWRIKQEIDKIIDKMKDASLQELTKLCKILKLN